MKTAFDGLPITIDLNRATVASADKILPRLFKKETRVIVIPENGLPTPSVQDAPW